MRTVWKAADILLPAEGVDMALWPALACDQFTSQPEYWQRAEALCMDAPSTLHITLPEVYLEQRGVAAHISTIHAAMREYALGVLTRRMHGFVYTERRFPGKAQVRCGLVGAVDLEAYSYEKGARALVRPSENTVVERIPPRLAVRRGALLESPHILMLLDDEARSVIEPFAAQKAALTQLYDTDLMLNGGRVAGWAVTDEAAIKSVENAVARFGTQEVFDAKYPAAKGAAPLALAVGDGNHSLATAKAYWEELKATLTAEEQKTHPARLCLVELVNVHSEAIEIEPIHRAVFGTDSETFTEEFSAWLRAGGADLCVRARPASDTSGDADFAAGKPCVAAQGQCFTVVAGSAQSADHTLCVTNAPHPLAVGTLEQFLPQFCAAHPGTHVDFIHGETAVRELSQRGAVGILLPDFAKSDVFCGVVLGGVLPRKTFSMGEATEKRYYLECRKIAL
ncbi:MAG: DUF1015 domain-containing protein [Ruthenibacterium sp.]